MSANESIVYEAADAVLITCGRADILCLIILALLVIVNRMAKPALKRLFSWYVYL